MPVRDTWLRGGWLYKICFINKTNTYLKNILLSVTMLSAKLRCYQSLIPIPINMVTVSRSGLTYIILYIYNSNFCPLFLCQHELWGGGYTNICFRFINFAVKMRCLNLILYQKWMDRNTSTCTIYFRGDPKKIFALHFTWLF